MVVKKNAILVSKCYVNALAKNGQSSLDEIRMIYLYLQAFCCRNAACIPKMDLRGILCLLDCCTIKQLIIGKNLGCSSYPAGYTSISAPFIVIVIVAVL